MEVKVNQNIALNLDNSSISLPSEINSTSNSNKNITPYQQPNHTEVEEMNLDLDYFNNQNNDYSSTQIGESLKSIENIKPNIKNILEKARDPFNPTKKELLEAIYIYMINQSVDNIDLNYSNLLEMQNKIDSLTKEIEESRENELYLEMSEAQATSRFINYLFSGSDSLEETAKNCPIAYKCQDDNGDTFFVYGDLAQIFGKDYKIIETISYMDMYGESETFKRIKEMFSNHIQGKNYEWTNEFKQFYNEIIASVADEGYYDYYNDNETTQKLIEERNTLKSLKEYISSELNYYLNNIDPYVNAENFNQHNIYLDNNQNLESICNGKSYKSGYVETKNITSVEDMITLLSCSLNNTNNIWKDTVYVYNDEGTVTGVYKITCNDGTFNHYLNDWKEILSDEEIKIFNYINNTQGAKSAYKYLKDISTIIDQRWLTNERLKDKEWAENNKILASIGSIFVTPLEGLGAAYHSLNSLISKEEVWRTDVYSRGDQWRGSVTAAIEENHPLGAFVYGTAMSMADSGALIALNTITAGSGTAALSAVTMGSRSYVSSLNDALDRGVENNKAIGYAFGAAAIETICENYSVGHLMNLEEKIGDKTLSFIKKLAPENSLKSKVLYVAAGAITQGLAEGEEELCTEILNSFWDQIVCDDNSNFNLAIKSYEEQGMSEFDAILNAFKDEATQCSLSFAGGFLSGVGFGGAKAAKISNIATKENINIYDLDEQIKEENEHKNNTSIKKAATTKTILSNISNLFRKTTNEVKIAEVRRSSYQKLDIPSFDFQKSGEIKGLIYDIEFEISRLQQKDDNNSKIKIEELIIKKIIAESKLKSIFKVDTESLQFPSIKSATEAEIISSIKEEINGINNANEDYQIYIDLLKRKKDLELSLCENLKKESNTSKFSTLNESLQCEVEAKAKEIYDNLVNIENSITKDIQDLRGSDAYLADLRVESIEKIKEEIARLLTEDGNVNAAASEVYNSLSYNLIVSEETYSNSVIEKISQLVAKGYELKNIKNAWGNKTYQGLEVNLTSPSGDSLVIHFHTKDSYNINKKINNELYEISRGTYTNDTKKLSNEIQSINQRLYVNSVNFEYNDVQELQEAITNHIKNKQTNTKKIVCTDINEEHAYDKELSVYEGVEYLKYPGTELPKSCVIDTEEEILKYGSSILDGLKAIEEIYGKSSIQATTARGTAVMNFINNNRETNEDFYIGIAEGVSNMQKRIKSVYEAAGIKVKDYTEDILAKAESTDNHSKLLEISNKICNELFKSHHDYWEKMSSEDIDTMHKYTKGYDDKINTTLRTGEIVDELCPQLIEKLISQISSLESLKETTLMYRGLRNLDWICDGALNGYNFSRLAKVLDGLGGGIYEIGDNAFASSTPVLSQGFTCTREIIEITAYPEGTKGTYIGDLSLCPAEVEYLVSPGYGNKKIILGAEELGNNILIYTQILE